MGLLKSTPFILLVFQTAVFAWQVKGRSTLPSDCRPGETWVTDHSKSTGNWTAFCRALPSGLGSKAYKYWASRFQPSRPYDWPFLEERTTDWQSKDVKDALWAVERIPEHLWDPSLRGLYRMHKSRDHPNPGAQRKDSIILYDPAFQNEEYLARILVHELAHKKFRSFSDEQRADYAKAAGWTVTKNRGGKYEFESPKCCFVQPDAGTSIDENFANNVEYYLHVPETLKKTDPKSYYWIEKHFGSNFKIRGSK